MPLLSGDAGTAQTVRQMAALVDAALRDPVVHRQAVEIVRHVPSHDSLGELRAIFNWVHGNIRFTNDPPLKEMLIPPAQMLQIRSGDCDDFVMLGAALAGSVGFRTRAVTVAADHAQPGEFSHVYLEADLDGEWIPMDAARPGAQFGLAPANVYRSKFWDLTSGDGREMDFAGSGGGSWLSGVRLRGLAGLGHAGCGGSCGCGGTCGENKMPPFGTGLGGYDPNTGEYTAPGDCPGGYIVDSSPGPSALSSPEYICTGSSSGNPPLSSNMPAPVYGGTISPNAPGNIITEIGQAITGVVSASRANPYMLNPSAYYGAGAASPYGASPFGSSLGAGSFGSFLPWLLIGGAALLLLGRR